MNVKRTKKKNMYHSKSEVRKLLLLFNIVFKNFKNFSNSICASYNLRHIYFIIIGFKFLSRGPTVLDCLLSTILKLINLIGNSVEIKPTQKSCKVGQLNARCAAVVPIKSYVRIACGKYLYIRLFFSLT